MENTLQVAIDLCAHSDSWTRLIKGFKMLSQHRLHPDLMNMERFPEALTRMAKKLEDSGYQANLQELEDLFHCLTSRLVYDNGIILIMVHIPTYNVGTKMQLYEFHSLPLPVSRTINDLLILNMNERYLAVSDDEATYQVLTTEE